MPIPNERDTKLREEWRTHSKSIGVHYNANTITDWWLSKIDEEVERKVREIREEISETERIFNEEGIHVHGILDLPSLQINSNDK